MLKTNRARFSEAMIDSQMAILSAQPSATAPVLSTPPTSPASRPTPTTLIGPFGSRSPVPKAA